MPTRNDSIDKLVAAVQDFSRQVSRLIGTVNGVIERFARGYEELDGIRLSIEEQRELLADHFQENIRHADKLDKSLRELQRYIIAVKMTGGNQETREIESKFSKQQIEDELREELVRQQDLLKQHRRVISQYQANINLVQERIAKFGETTNLVNEMNDYQNQIDDYTRRIQKAEESMARIREQLE